MWGGVCLSACWDTTPPGGDPPGPGNPLGGDPHGTRYPLGGDPPRPGTPPSPVQSMLGDMVNAWVVRIQLECNLVDPNVFTSVYQEFCPRGWGGHVCHTPPAMHTPCHACPPPCTPPPCTPCHTHPLPPSMPPAMHAPPMLRDAVNERAVRILLECILVMEKYNDL